MLDLIVQSERLRLLKRVAHKEFLRQWPLFKERWKTILAGAAFQYVHAIFTQLAYRMAQPATEPLHDLGFALLPELGQNNEWVSEFIFSSMLFSFIIWTFSPFWQESGKRFYTAVLYARVLMVLTTHGCGDLIFSSHTTFALVGVMSYQEYGTQLIVKVIVWTGAAILSILIVASRKHYTVDVLVAWYVVPLVFYTCHRRWTTKRSVKEEWPHRPLPEEQLVELECINVLNNQEVSTKQPSTVNGVSQVNSQRNASSDLQRTMSKDLGIKNIGDQAYGHYTNNFLGVERMGAPAITTVMRPRSTQTLIENLHRPED